MVPVALALGIGFAIGVFRRPYGAHIHGATLVLPITGVLGALLQTLGVLDLMIEGQVLGVSLALLTGFALVNRHLVGMGVLAIGLTANLIVVLANGGMPVRPSALVDSGAVTAAELADTDLGFGRQFETDNDLVVGMGDIIPVPILHAAMSFGDIIILFGLATVSGDLARYARRGKKTPLFRTQPAGEPIRPPLDLHRRTRVIDLTDSALAAESVSAGVLPEGEGPR